MFKKGKYTAIKRNEIRSAFLFLTPLIIGLLVFYFYAFFQNILYSFTDLSSFGEPNFVGFDNYKRLFEDPKFYMALSNTIKYVLLGVPAVVILSTIAAALINSKIKLQGFFRTALFIPAVTMPAAIGLLWRWLYNYEFGIINFILDKLGFEKIAWLSDPKVVLISITIVLVWSMISTNMIIILAGLQGISRSYYEAAEIDGASGLKSFFLITLPLLSPTLFFVTIMATIGIFQIFDFIFLMVQPTALSMQYSMSLVYYFYDRAFMAFEKGYAASISMVLFVIILLVTVLQFVLQKKWVHYE
ncbi:sugar ABC transporter permease [Acidaminobacter sp. JC074]|uniref:carbohydrate ABC transporter permease n=1 Tax=Acidaminobacter sp. JC074 TaxID=2530199 RepID=UPI001F0E5108|nr:sugar ABC transporter permease [Acidaminobacter sp. JC074]MCH4888979.1 sugar ABC transporter permease [Acidaminobacter sp. JC074]